MAKRLQSMCWTNLTRITVYMGLLIYLLSLFPSCWQQWAASWHSLAFVKTDVAKAWVGSIWNTFSLRWMLTENISWVFCSRQKKGLMVDCLRRSREYQVLEQNSQLQLSGTRWCFYWPALECWLERDQCQGSGSCTHCIDRAHLGREAWCGSPQNPWKAVGRLGSLQSSGWTQRCWQRRPASKDWRIQILSASCLHRESPMQP